MKLLNYTLYYLILFIIFALFSNNNYAICLGSVSSSEFETMYDYETGEPFTHWSKTIKIYLRSGVINEILTILTPEQIKTWNTIKPEKINTFFTEAMESLKNDLQNLISVKMAIASLRIEFHLNETLFLQIKEHLKKSMQNFILIKSHKKPFTNKIYEFLCRATRSMAVTTTETGQLNLVTTTTNQSPVTHITVTTTTPKEEIEIN